MSVRMRLALVVLASCGGFVLIANLAVIWHGALFVALVPVLAWLSNVGIDWARATGRRVSQTPHGGGLLLP